MRRALLTLGLVVGGLAAVYGLAYLLAYHPNFIGVVLAACFGAVVVEFAFSLWEGMKRGNDKTL